LLDISTINRKSRKEKSGELSCSFVGVDVATPLKQI